MTRCQSLEREITSNWHRIAAIACQLLTIVYTKLIAPCKCSFLAKKSHYKNGYQLISFIINNLSVFAVLGTAFAIWNRSVFAA